MIDVDVTTPYKALGLAKLLMEHYPEVGNCLIMRTHEDRHVLDQVPRYHTFRGLVFWRSNFHLIFGGMIGRDNVFAILDMLAGLDVLDQTFIDIRRDRGDMTLRINAMRFLDRARPAPEFYQFLLNVRYPFGGDGIERYLHYLRQFRDL